MKLITFVLFGILTCMAISCSRNPPPGCAALNNENEDFIVSEDAFANEAQNEGHFWTLTDEETGTTHAN